MRYNQDEVATKCVVILTSIGIHHGKQVTKTAAVEQNVAGRDDLGSSRYIPQETTSFPTRHYHISSTVLLSDSPTLPRHRRLLTYIFYEHRRQV